MPCLAGASGAVAVLFASMGVAAADHLSAAPVTVHNHARLRGTGNPDDSLPLASSFVQTRQKARRVMSRDPEQLIAWEDSHQAIGVDTRKFSQAKLLEMGRRIDAKAFGATLHGLCDNYRSRFVGTSGNVDTSQKIRAEFSKLGLQTWIEDLAVTQSVKQYLRSNASRNVGGNVIGLLRGTDLAHETVVLGAHYDSVNWESEGGASPGVDDNGSGAALVQLVARAVVRSGVRPRRSLMFVGFNAEEEGLVGSEQMARKAMLGTYGDVKAVLIADEVAYPGSGSGSRKAIFETVGDVPGTAPLVDTLAHNALFQHGDGISGFEVNLHGFGSDHISFLRHSFPALLLIERNNIAHSDKWGHSVRDNYDHVDFAYGASMSRLMLRAVAALSSPADSSLKTEGPLVQRSALY